MKATTFPLPWEQVRWRSRRCAVSDFRLVTFRARVFRAEVTSGEIALDDIAGVDVETSLLARVTGVGTLVIRSTRQADAPLRVRGVAGARRAALTLNLLIADIRRIPPPDAAMASLPLPSIWRIRPAMPLQAALIAPSMVPLTIIAVMIGLGSHQSHATYSGDDPIRPNGVARSRAEIMTFMEAEVMPFAKVALEPIVGPGKVRCETCHGADAVARDWTMPAILALPEPAVRGMAQDAGSDSQIRNAIHGYLATEAKQRTARHMRGVVLPGMAALLRRPVYDFAQSYEFNNQRSALGCYHCHMVKAGI